MPGNSSGSRFLMRSRLTRKQR